MNNRPYMPFVGAGTFNGGNQLVPLHWLDASDASTLTLSGAAVTSWADKGSAGGAWTQSTPANRPAYSASDLGYAGVRFNAASAQEVTRSRVSLPAEVEIHLVWRIDADPPASAGSSGIWKLGNASTAAPVVPWTGGGNYDNAASNVRHDATTHTTNFSSANGVYSVVSTSAEWTNFENFTQRYTTGTNTVDMPATLGIGSSTPSFSMSGVVRELRIYAKKLTAAQRASVQAEFSAKWGTP